MEALTNKSLTSVSQGRVVTLAVTTPPPWLELSKSGRVQYLGTGISNFCFFKQEQVDWGDLIENHQQQNYKMHVPTISLSSALCVFVLISYVCFDILNYDECLFINKSIWSLQSGLFQIFWMCEQNKIWVRSCAPKKIVFLNFSSCFNFSVCWTIFCGDRVKVAASKAELSVTASTNWNSPPFQLSAFSRW